MSTGRRQTDIFDSVIRTSGFYTLCCILLDCVAYIIRLYKMSFFPFISLTYSSAAKAIQRGGAGWEVVVVEEEDVEKEEVEEEAKV